MKPRKENSTLSSEVVKYLTGRGYRQKEIAKLLNVDDSFISHVVKGKRNFTLDHLEQLARTQGTTLPELLALATPMETVPPKLREGYELFLKGLRDLTQLREHAREAEVVEVGK